MQYLLSLADLDGFDFAISPETIGAICFVLGINALVIGLAVFATARERRFKVQFEETHDAF